jgi:uncharacterized integral membrane protein (TIGR00698 family)
VTPRRRSTSPLPGLSIAIACTATAFGLARLPGGAVAGPLVLALALGALWRGLVLGGRGLERYAPGAQLAAGPLLKLGIVALGARLDLRAVAELGPWIVVGSAIGAMLAFGVAELAGRALGVAPGLRRVTGIGTAICGASAIAAAAPVLRATPAHATASIGAISLLGTVGVLGFAAWDALADVAAGALGPLAGATLQEVGHVVAAGSVAGGAGADLALLVKLSRVVMLAPALVALSWWTSRRALQPAVGAPVDAAAPTPSARPWPIPPFVVGFVVLGAAVSAGWLGAAAVAWLATLGTVLTAIAMAGLGLGLDVRALRGPGRQALAVGLAAFVALVLVMAAYYALVV